MAAPRPRILFAAAAPSSPFARYAGAAAAALGEVAAVRIVPATELIGRDLRECHRFVCEGRTTFALAGHLRELSAQIRDRTIALLVGPAAIAVTDDAEELALLRRNCGRVVVDSDEVAHTLRRRLLAPVHVISADDLTVAWPQAIWSVLALAPGSPDTVEAHLVEAQQWLMRGDPSAAFGAAARALQLAPDQPGIVADVARLLASLGEPDRARALCRSFLRQRPEADVVRAALTELGGALPPPSATIDASENAVPAPQPT